MSTERLARFVIETARRDIPDAALDAARAAFVDTLGCALAGLREPASELSAQWVQETGGRSQAVVWGRAFGASPADAAFANAVASHALDFDDALPSLRGHPSTSLVPTALAVGQVAGSSGESVLTAYVLGLEIAGKLGAALGDGHYFRGWHTTATVGVLASTAVAARLWRLTPDELAMAWGMAASQASGLLCNFGSMTKPFHAGHAARAGVLSAWLAKRGFSSAPAILETPGGFLATYAGEGVPPLGELADRLGRPWEIFEPGLFFKRWPCCYGNHRAVAGLLQLVAAHGIAADEIEGIEVGFPPGGDSALISTDPQTGLEAKFSIEYCAAAAVLDGGLVLESFTDERVQRQAVRRLMARVRRRRIDAEGSFSGLKGFTEVTVETARGRFHERVEKTPGSPAWPLAEHEVAAKFGDGATPVLGAERAAQLYGLLQRFRQLADVNGLAQAAVPEQGVLLRLVNSLA